LASEKASSSPDARSADVVGAARAGQLGRAVGGAVGGDDQLEALARVVEREDVGDLGGDHALLVVGGDDQRHARQLAQGDWATITASECLDEERIEDVGVDDQPGRRPERRRHGRHGCADLIGRKRRLTQRSS
jgi:hypothetical protein